ncbi:MAG: TrmH family RNA methyltransferase [Vicinamibacterales bacterium]
MPSVTRPAITSRQHPLVQAFKRAARGGPDTPALLDGWHLVAEAASAGIPIETVAVVADAVDDTRAAMLDHLASAGTRLVTVSAAVLDAMSPVRTPAGIVALVTRPSTVPGAAVHPAPALALLAVGMQDPGNVGATLRAAEAGGATGVLLAGDSADPFGWKALRASMGSALRLPAPVVDDPLEACRHLREAGVRLLATTPRGGQPMDRVDLTGPVAFILGGEGPGLSDTIVAAADAGITIPMSPPVESLNVAVAAALLVYEARRQRRQLQHT